MKWKKKDCTAYFSANSAWPSFKRKKPTVFFHVASLPGRIWRICSFLKAYIVTPSPSHKWVHQHDSFTCLPCTAQSCTTSLERLVPCLFNGAVDFRGHSVCSNLHGASTRKELHYLLHICQLSGTKVWHVAYFIHYNLSRYPGATFLPELLICGQMRDPPVGACCKLCYTQHSGKCIITVMFFRRYSSWWSRLLWLSWGQGKEMPQ